MMRFLGNLGTNKYRQNKTREERIRVQVEKEDFLLNQIDEFREKAKQLQELLTAKESKVKELQSLVDEREGKAQELQNILNKKQQEADKLNQAVKEQVDSLIEKVEDKIDELGEGLKQTVTESANDTDAKTEEMKTALQDMKQQLVSVKNELSDKIHDENVNCYRNIKTLFDELGEKDDKMDNLESNMRSIKAYVKCLSWFSIVNFIVLVVFILYQLGIFF